MNQYPLDLSMGEFINGQTILITGGTGTFGHAMVSILSQHFQPHKIIVFSRDEYKQSTMNTKFPNQENLRFFLGDIRDIDRLRFALSNVDIVFHAAALKQVPTLEYNPTEAIKTNILGTMNLVQAAIEKGVKRVMFISTDKAVCPINLYGATKLCAEKLVINANNLSGRGGTIFSVTRYGNIMGSRGSVIPIFRQQLKNRKITITDPNMTRFCFMIEDAVSFVLKCTSLMHGREIFIPILSSYTVEQLVRVMINSESLNDLKEIEIEHIGLRPGEKIHESMVSEHELKCTTSLRATGNNILIIHELPTSPNSPLNIPKNSGDAPSIDDASLTEMINQS